MSQYSSAAARNVPGFDMWKPDGRQIDLLASARTLEPMWNLLGT